MGKGVVACPKSSGGKHVSCHVERCQKWLKVSSKRTHQGTFYKSTKQHRLDQSNWSCSLAKRPANHSKPSQHHNHSSQAYWPIGVSPPSYQSNILVFPTPVLGTPGGQQAPELILMQDTSRVASERADFRACRAPSGRDRRGLGLFIEAPN